MPPEPHMGGESEKSPEVARSEATDAGSPVASSVIPEKAGRRIEDDKSGTRYSTDPPDFLKEHNARVLRSWEIPKDAKGPERVVRLYETDFHYPLIRSEEIPASGTGAVADSMESVLSMVGDHLIVMPKPGTTKEALRQAVQAQGFDVRETPATSPFVLAVFDPRSRDGSLEAAQRQIAGMEDMVASVEPDYLVSAQVEANDPAYELGTLWGLHHFSNYDIDAREGWGHRTSASEIVVAVLDTGVMTVHEDLAPNIWVNSGEIPNDGLDNDGNGWVDDVHGVNLIDPSKSHADDNGHGTHIAGTIGAVGNNDRGVTGVAWDVQLMPLKFLSSLGRGTTSNAINGIYYAVEMDADIINGSFGGGTESQAMRMALEHAYANGVIFVAAAGNNSSNNDYRPQYPASYDLNNVVSVASHDRDGELSRFSNFGAGTVDLSAPGGSIWSTSFVKRISTEGAVPATNPADSSYEYLSGTSMAAPHVSGVLALLKAEFPAENVNQLLNRLYASVKPNAATAGKVRFGGILSLSNAMDESSTTVIGDDFNDPIILSWPFANWTGSTVGATDDVNSGYKASRSGSGSLWFTVLSEQDGWMKVSFDADSADGWIAVYDESRPDASALFESQNSSETGYFQTEAGTTYRIRVDSEGTALENYNFSVAQRAPNDNLNEATDLGSSSFALKGFNFGATHEPDEPKHAKVGTKRSVWYRWTAPEDGTFYLDTNGSRFDTVLAVYTQDADTLNEIAADDDSGHYLTSALQFPAVSGEEYFVAVDSFRDTLSGHFKLNGGYEADILLYSQPQSRNAKVGDIVTLSVGVNSALPLSFQWYRDGEAVSGGNQNVLRFWSLREQDFGTYHCVIKNEHTTRQSDSADILEFKSAPEIAWQSGSKARASGSFAEFSVRAFGSLPLTFEWKKDGLVLPGADSSLLSIASVDQSDVGIYEVIISNSEGTRRSKQMALNIANDPLEKWIWRNPQPQGNDIESLLVYDGQYYAVATGGESTLLRSTDGNVWQSIELPGEMRVFDMTYGNGQFVAVGQGGSSWDPKPILTSPDGITWTKHLIDFGFGTPQSIEFSNGRYVLRTGDRDIWYSLNGTDWQKSSLSGIGALRSGNGRFLALKLSSGPYAKTVYSSSDGATWEEATIPSETWPYWEFCHFVDGYFYVNFSPDVFRSTDGITWEFIGSGGLKEVMGGHNGEIFGIQNGDYSYSTTATLPNWSSAETIRGADSQKTITHAVMGPDRIVLGGEGGLLASAPTLARVNLGDVNKITVDLERVISTDHGFYAFNKLQRNMYYSADGSDWGEIKLPNSLDYSVGDIHYANGLFWAKSSNPYTSGDQYLYKGTHPASLEPLLDAQQGNMVDIVYGNGRYYMIQLDHGSTSSAKFYESTDGVNWTHNSAITVSGNDRLYSMDGRVIVSRWSKVSINSSGSSWRTLNLSGGFGYENGILAADGEIYVYDAYNNFHVSDDGGANWTKTPTNSNFSTVPNLYKIDGQFVIVFADRFSVSNDGVSWASGTTNGRFNDVAFGLDTFVGVGDDGIIMQSGSPVSSAPIVEFISPVDYGTISEFSEVPVEVSAFDPEGKFQSIHCYWKGDLVYSSTSEGTHTFTVFVEESGVGDLRAEASDEDGIVSTALIQVSVLKSSVPSWQSAYSDYESMGSTQMGEDIYVFTRDGLTLRSNNIEDWETVQLPKIDDKPNGAAFGNELIVLSSQDGSFYTSSDGENWAASSLDAYSARLEQAVQFNDGLFAAPYTNSSLGSGIAFSRDAFNWVGSQTSPQFRFSKIVLGNSGQGLAINRAQSLDPDLYSFQITQDAQVVFTNPGLGRAVDATWGKGRFLAIMEDGSIQSSSDLTTWSSGSWWGAMPNIIEFLGNRFLLRSGSDVLAVSENGLDWTPAEGSAIANELYYFSGQYIGVTTSAVYTSFDGISWIKKGDKPSSSSVLWQLADERYASITDEGVIYSEDLESWTLEVGMEHNRQRIENIVAGNGIWVAEHSLHHPGIAWSEDQGKTWGQTVSGLSDIASVQSIDPVAFGAGKFLVRINADLYESTDGKNWSLVMEDAPSGIRFDQLRQIFVGAASGGRFARSDDGINWEYFLVDETQNTMVIVPDGPILIALQGTALSGMSNLAVSQDNGASWEPGANPDTNIHDYAVLDGAVVLLTSNRYSTYSTHQSTDGFNWSQSVNHLAGGSSGPRDLSEGLNGLVYLNPEGELYRSTDGSTWEFLSQVDLVDGVSVVDSKVFLTGKRIVRYTGLDWVNRSLSVAGGEYGIGDTLQIDFEIYNASTLGTAPEPLEIEFRLSKDRYWSMDDPILGTAEIDTDLPLQNQNNQWSVEGTIPETVRGGAYYVLSQINPNNPSQERYSNNNFKNTSLADVVVPEWTLNVTTNGSGETEQDTSAVRYSNNALVNLVALENKHTEFTGWEGDAPAGLNQLTLTMNEDKNLTASFNTYHLLLHEVSGGGRLELSSDQERFEPGASVTLTAVPEEGWSFVGWSGDQTGSNPVLSLTMNADQNLTAHFGQTYLQWQEVVLTGASDSDLPPGADPDGDGLPNVQEYLAGTDPMSANPETDVVSTDFTPSSLLVRYWAKKGDLDGTIRVMSSEDLAVGWEQMNSHMRILEEENQARLIEVEIPYHEADRRFVKLHYMLQN